MRQWQKKLMGKHEMTNTAKTPFHAPYIDGLRAIAVVSVILYHLNSKYLPGGFVGVDVFFVISGFVVAISVSNLRHMGFLQFVAYFYARRLVRITPALFVCLLVTFLVSALFIPEAWLSSSNSQTGLFAFFGLSNFILAGSSGNYFSPTAEFNPFTHTWSLAVEEQFYLIFPVIFFVWLRGKASVSVVVLLIAFVASILAASIIGKTDSAQAFYMIWTRFWELSAGVLLFQLMSLGGHSFNHSTTTRNWHGWLANLGLVALAIGLLIARPESTPYPGAILPVFATVLILGVMHGRSGTAASYFLTRPAMIFIGKISYSLYLWHWPIFVVFRWTVGLESVVFQAIALLLTFAFAIASYYVIEQPPRHLARKAKKLVLITLGLALIGSGYAAASVIVSNQERLSLSTVTRNKGFWYPEGISTPGNGCSVESKTENFDGGAVIVHRRANCDDTPRNGRNVFVIGDSHAGHYNAMLKQYVAETGAQVNLYAVGGCAFISMRPSPTPEDPCSVYGRSAVAHILTISKPGDVVLLSSLRIPRMVDQWDSMGGFESVKTVQRTDQEVKARHDSVERAVPYLRDMVAAGLRVVFPTPTPLFQSIAYRCSDWFNRLNPICAKGLTFPRDDLDALRGPVLNAFSEIQKQVPQVEVWDTTDILCPERECSVFREGKPLFFDGDHLSNYANMLLLPSFRKMVEQGSQAGS